MGKITNIKQASEFLNIPKNEISFFWKYDNDNWSYIDKNDHAHLFRFIEETYIELTKDVDATFVSSFNDGYWLYEDKNDNYYLFNQNNKLIEKNSMI